MGEAAVDALLGGRLSLRQPRTGHRVGTDALLLAAASRGAGGADFVDVGAGVGAVGLALATLDPTARGRLLEADAGAAAMARENCALNGLAGRVAVAEADLFSAAACRAAGLGPERAGLVLTNPPFHRAGAVRASADPSRAAAHVAGPHGHAAWLRAAAALLSPGGTLVMIHRPDALPALIEGSEGRLGGLAIRPVHPRAGGAAARVLVAGVKGSRAPLRLLAGLVLHEADGRFTSEAEAIHRGEAAIPM